MKLKTDIREIKLGILIYSQYTQTEYLSSVAETVITEFSSYAAF